LVQVARSRPIWAAGPAREAREKLQREAVPRLHELLAENDRLRAELAAAMIATEAPKEAAPVATRAATRARIAAALRAAPALSDRQHARALAVSDKTVASVRAALVASADLPQLDRTVGADGRSRAARRPQAARARQRGEPCGERR
jgi:hypothetical protein